MPAADGMKTGFICDSGFNLVASATFEDRRLISVVMGAKSAPSRNVLTQVLLESADVMAEADEERPMLRELTSTPAGSGEPRSLQQMMCGDAGKVSLESPDEPMNWGVSLGRYPAPLTAEAVLTGRLLATGEAAGRPRGVVREADSYLALVWNMSMRDTLALCARMQRFDASCQVMSPRSFARLSGEAESLAGDSAAPAPPQSEGSQ
jgi:hypothetical protein